MLLHTLINVLSQYVFMVWCLFKQRAHLHDMFLREQLHIYIMTPLQHIEDMEVRYEY